MFMVAQILSDVAKSEETDAVRDQYTEASLCWLEKAASMGQMRAMKQIAQESFRVGAFDVARRWLQKLALNGDAGALNLLVDSKGERKESHSDALDSILMEYYGGEKRVATHGDEF